MIADYEDILRFENRSFALKKRSGNEFEFRWHFNDCYELTLITKGSGRRYVGDDISAFSAGDLVLLAPELPHTWASYDNKSPCEAFVLHFNFDFGNESFLNAPEMNKIADMLKKADKGIYFGGKTVAQIQKKFVSMNRAAGWRKAALFIEILGSCCECERIGSLSTCERFGEIDSKNQTRFGNVCRYLNANFTKPLSQAQTAKKAFMSPSRFSQFFKEISGKSFTEYLTELRVGYACKLLIETDKTVTAICFEAGFGNSANFNRRFKKIKQITPRQYRRQFSDSFKGG